MHNNYFTSNPNTFADFSRGDSDTPESLLLYAELLDISREIELCRASL